MDWEKKCLDRRIWKFIGELTMLECLGIQKNLQISAVDENKGCFAGFGGLYLIKNNLL
jgi:hypothetical protein